MDRDKRRVILNFILIFLLTLLFFTHYKTASILKAIGF